MSAAETNDSAKSIADAPPVPPRDHLVETAANFLQSPQVYKSPIDMKTAFLKKKGLSDVEIELAIKMSEEMVQSRVPKNMQPAPSPPHVAIDMPLHPYLPQQSRLSRIRDVVNTVALFAGVAYFVFWFYKKYIAPYLFGRKPLESRISDLEKSISDHVIEIKSNINKIKEDVEKITEHRSGLVNRQIEELKTEVTSLKKLLLNRKQFPTASVTGPLSIPAWQRAASPPGEKETEEEGIGSGTNGSDSSLEMIKE